MLKDIEIVTVWYNRAYQVEESIYSILNQTISNYSILAVDDGSTDGTGEKLEEMCLVAKEKNINMKVIRKKNEGFVKSIKIAIEEYSNGNVIALHGAGDISEPSRLEKQLKHLFNNKNIVVVGCGVKVDNRITRKQHYRQVNDLPNQNIFDGVVPRPGTHGAAMFYKDIYQRTGGYREFFKYGQDTDLWLRICKFGDIANLNEILYTKVVTGSTVSGDYKKQIEQRIYSTIAFQSFYSINNKGEDFLDNINHTDSLLSIVDKKLLLKRLGHINFYLLRKKKIIDSFKATMFIIWLRLSLLIKHNR